MKSEKMKQYEAFENFVEVLFSDSGYEVKKQTKLKVNGSKFICADLVASNEGREYLIEIKYSIPKSWSFVGYLNGTLSMVAKVADHYNMIPVLVVPSVVGDDFRNAVKEINDEFIVLDAANILAITHNNPKYRNEFVSILPYVVDDIKPVIPKLVLCPIQQKNYASGIIDAFKNCKIGKKHYRDFEMACTDILKFIFSDELALWKEQNVSNKSLYRFDLLCRVKSGEHHEFWEIMERYFNSKYIVFEFKNYREKVKQQEIYTTEKYLYHKALRSVAIIIAASGYDINSQWAAKGCLRENGKLIILLDKNDLIKMYNLKMKQENPSQWLLENLDELLSELEK